MLFLITIPLLFINLTSAFSISNNYENTVADDVLNSFGQFRKSEHLGINNNHNNHNKLKNNKFAHENQVKELERSINMMKLEKVKNNYCSDMSKDWIVAKERVEMVYLPDGNAFR
eukprot:Pgem_evm1s269